MKRIPKKYLKRLGLGALIVALLVGVSALVIHANQRADRAHAAAAAQPGDVLKPVCEPLSRALMCNNDLGKEKPESQLYSMLEKEPALIKFIVFHKKNMVEVQLVQEGEDAQTAAERVFMVTVGGELAEQKIRELASDKGVPFQSGEGGDKPESHLYGLLKNSPNKVKQLEFAPDSVTVTEEGETAYNVSLGGEQDQQALRELALAGDVQFTTETAVKSSGSGMKIAAPLIILLIVVAVTFIIFHKLVRHSASSGARGVRRGSDTVATEMTADTNVRFSDVIGQPEAKEALMDIVHLTENRALMKEHDATIPKGIVLYGPPGNGKTLLVKALAGESGLPMFKLNGSDLMEKYVGVGAARVRELVAAASKKAQETGQLVIIFFDEIDAFAGQRSGDSKADGEQVQTLNALLDAIDGFDSASENLLFIAGTNRYHQLDRALLRAGRFDRKIMVRTPSFNDRLELFTHYLRKKKHGELDLTALARKASGFSGASIANVCNLAANALVLSILKREANPGHITQESLLAGIETEMQAQPKDSVAVRVNPAENDIRFKDVIGQDEAKKRCHDLLDFFRAPEKFKENGVKAPRGTLFYGDPGEGKTLLAKAIAGEANVPVFVVSGSDFVETYVGTGAARMRELFDEARRNGPCIIFIDEIDAVGGKRSNNPNGGDQEHAQTLNALLTCMDGFKKNSDVIVIAATNRPDMLDDALKRPGRFDRSIELRKPDRNTRLELFKFYTRDKKLAADVDLEFHAKNTAGFSGASIANVCNEAWLHQSRANREAGRDAWDVTITSHAIDEAILTETMGGSASRLLTQEELHNIAVHEAGGHAAVYHVVTGGKMMARITVIGRGQSLGHVQFLNDDRPLMTKKELENMICSALGGRIAQEELLGTIDTGASNDFQQAYKIARAMVVDYGMSPLGVIIKLDDTPFSPDKLVEIENATQQILKDCDNVARTIIRENKDTIEYVVAALLEKETVLGSEYQKLWEEGTKISITKS